MSRQIIPANPLNGFYQLIGELGHDYWTELSKHSKQNFIAFQEESDSFFFNPQYEYWSQHLTLIAKSYTSVKQEDDSVTYSKDTFAAEKEMTKTHSNRSLDTLISLIIQTAYCSLRPFPTST